MPSLFSEDPEGPVPEDSFRAVHYGKPEHTAPDAEPGHYYVSAIKAGRYRVLVGPYERHGQALEELAFVRRVAFATEVEAPLWPFTTSRIDPVPDPPSGRLNAVCEYASAYQSYLAGGARPERPPELEAWPHVAGELEERLRRDWEFGDTDEM